MNHLARSRRVEAAELRGQVNYQVKPMAPGRQGQRFIEEVNARRAGLRHFKTAGSLTLPAVEQPLECETGMI